MTFQKGNDFGKNTSRKGVPNKSNTNLREAYLNAFDNMTEGMTGQEAFQAWARNNQSDFYKTCAKLIPKEIDVSIHKHEDFVQGLIEQELIREAEAKMLDSNGVAEEPEGNAKNKEKHIADVVIKPTGNGNMCVREGSKN